MTKRTQSQIITEYLLANGWQIDMQSRATRYRIFIHPTERLAGLPERIAKLYVGKAGALRVGPNVADSIPAPKRKAHILSVMRKGTQ
jgi:hypothetical protein